MTENELSYTVIGTAIELHKQLGPGLLESVYELALAKDLQALGLKIELQKGLPFEYKGSTFDKGFRLDALVEDKLILEIKSVEQLAPVHFLQTLTYLKLSNLKLGLLINFNSVMLKDNIHRIVNGL